MDKKVSIILLLILIILVGSILYISTDNSRFGSSSLKVPNGFKIIDNHNNTIVLTNNKTTYTITDNHNKSIDSIIKQYKDKHGNENVSENSKKVGNITVRSITLKKDNESVHTNYYYEKEGNTYHINVNGTSDPESFNYIINSTKKNILPF